MLPARLGWLASWSSRAVHHSKHQCSGSDRLLAFAAAGSKGSQGLPPPVRLLSSPGGLPAPAGCHTKRLRWACLVTSSTPGVQGSAALSLGGLSSALSWAACALPGLLTAFLFASSLPMQQGGTRHAW